MPAKEWLIQLRSPPILLVRELGKDLRWIWMLEREKDYQVLVCWIHRSIIVTKILKIRRGIFAKINAICPLSQTICNEFIKGIIDS